MGHFVTCKIFHIETPEFSIGFGPVLASYPIGDTQFSFRMLPLGGYVSIAGMGDENAGGFHERPYYQKAFVTLSGIICNIVLAMIIFTFISPREYRRRMQEEIGLERGFLGPIGIISVLMQTAQVGYDVFLGCIGVLSANLAFINALPLPFLDGGHFAQYTIQAINEQVTMTQAQQAVILTALFFIAMYIIYRVMYKR